MSSPQPPGTPGMNQREPAQNVLLLVDRYRIERAIGEGAYGRVYLALDTRLRRNVAIKELLASRERTDPAFYAEYLERFQREARATGVIQQPNVVTVYDEHVDDAGNHYLVMEYVDGTSLRDLLAQVGTLPVNRAVAITTDIARALEAVHEKGIVHRDIKPANLMISRRGVAKLTDFGIALVASENQMTAMTGSHPGTPGYMSPEQAMAYGPLDGRSDLYGLGLVLFEMLVGEPYARRHQPLGAVRPDLPPMLIAIVDKLMTPAADARYQSASDVLVDLQGLLLSADASQPVSTSGQMPVAMPPPGSFVPGGVPASYGGMPSQSPSSMPPGAPPGMMPPPGYTSGTAPLSTGYGAAPPSYGGPTGGPYSGPPQPQPKSNRGALFGIIGAVVGLVAVVAAVFIFTHRGNTPTATATPLVAVATPTTARVTTIANATTVPTATSDTGAVLTTPTRGPTIAVASATPATSATATIGATPSGITPVRTPTITATRPATTATSAPVALTDTWTDTDGLISMKFPGSWTKTRDNSDSTNLVEFSVSNGPFVDVYLNDPQQGTVAEEIQIITRNQGNSQKYTYTNQATQDLTVAGEPAKVVTFTYTDKSDATKVFTGAWWIVNHDGRQYSIAVGPIGSFRATIDAMIASTAFPPTKVTTWLDPDKVMRTRYPNDWSASSDKDNVLILNGASDEIHIFVSIAPVGSTSIDQEFKAIRDSGSDDGKTVRTYDPVSDTKVGGQPAKSMAYKYAQKSNPNLQPGIATIWALDYQGKRYEFFCSNIASHRQEIEAFINTVAFLK